MGKIQTPCMSYRFYRGIHVLLMERKMPEQIRYSRHPSFPRLQQGIGRDLCGSQCLEYSAIEGIRRGYILSKNRYLIVIQENIDNDGNCFPCEESPNCTQCIISVNPGTRKTVPICYGNARRGEYLYDFTISSAGIGLSY